jgi:DNA mismatch repair protein MutS
MDSVESDRWTRITDRGRLRTAGPKKIVHVVADLTGPNMAGKTTYQCGPGRPAGTDRYGCSRDTGAPLSRRGSFYQPQSDRQSQSWIELFPCRSDARKGATILSAGRRALVIFDEVFKGTNVRDALDASVAVIPGFANARRSGIIFSSHLTELAEVLRPHRAIRFHCFDGDIQDGVPEYSYELQDGVSDKRFGLILLQQAEVPELIERISA